MLGVSTPPVTTNGFGGFGGPSSSKLPNVPTGSPNGNLPSSGSGVDSEIAEIKRIAQETVKQTLRAKSTLQSTRAATKMYTHGKEQEKAGDVKGALSALVKMQCIMQDILQHSPPSDFREAMKEWPSYKDDMADSLKMKDALEARLRQGSPAEDSDQTGGMKSIQERLQALRANGLQVSSKSDRRSVPSTPPSVAAPPPVQTPTSSGSSARRMSAPPSPLKQSSMPLSPLPRDLPPPIMAPSIPNAVPSGPLSPPVPSFRPLVASSSASFASHPFVPPTTLGDSPLSSPMNSPKIANGLHSHQEEEVDDYQSAADFFPSLDHFEMTHPTPRMDAPMPHVVSPAFGARFDPVERASSVPPAPSFSNMLPSRPASPTKPVLRRKPSILGNGLRDFSPKSSATPEDLVQFKRSNNIHTLLIDVRPRVEYDQERIDNQATICIEPYLLAQPKLNAEKLEGALQINPPNELTLFKNRHIFEYVVIYDQASTTQSRFMKTLLDVIFVNSTPGKGLKHPPMFLIGGLEAWRQALGGAEIVRGTGADATKSFASSASAAHARPLPPEPQTYGTPMSPPRTFTSLEPTQLWSPPRQEGHRASFSVESAHARDPAEIMSPGRLHQQQELARKPASRRPTVNGPAPSSYHQQPYLPNGAPYPANGISYPSPIGSHPTTPNITPPPQSLSHTLVRRRSDYMDPSTFTGPVSYPTPSSNNSTIARPPPAAVPGSDTRPRQMSLASHPTGSGNAPPAIPPKPQFMSPKNIIPYWSDVEIGMSGLRNMGNTCYMNSAVQCLSATVPFARFFTDGRWKNEINKYALRPGASKGSTEFLNGKTSLYFSNLLRNLWGADVPYIQAHDIWGHMAHQFETFNNQRQHDAGEWMVDILSLLSVELNRVDNPDNGSRPDEWFLDLALRPAVESNQKAWEKELKKENSIVFDCFGSLTRTMRQCQRCMRKSPSYLSNTIIPLSFPPKYGSSRLTPRQCFESIFQTDEDMKGGNQWMCPVCKSLQDAKATTRLARAPPVLMIQLGRYEDTTSGKKKNLADFPLRDLDISEWMVTLDSEPGPVSADDARAQRPPYRYDLYAVINHDGQTIDSGHYTSLILSGGRWKECNDSVIRNISNNEVVTSKAYVLCYKRKKT